VEKQFSDEFDKEEIITTIPEPGSIVFPGDTITLIVSEGESEEEGEGEGNSGEGNSGEGNGPPEGKGKDDD
jgi:hypothetical protein